MNEFLLYLLNSSICLSTLYLLFQPDNAKRGQFQAKQDSFDISCCDLTGNSRNGFAPFRS